MELGGRKSHRIRHKLGRCGNQICLKLRRMDGRSPVVVVVVVWISLCDIIKIKRERRLKISNECIKSEGCIR